MSLTRNSAPTSLEAFSLASALILLPSVVVVVVAVLLNWGR